MVNSPFLFFFGRRNGHDVTLNIIRS